MSLSFGLDSYLYFKKRKMMVGMLATVLSTEEKVTKTPAIPRKRWDSKYLLDLTVEEGSFINEHRMHPNNFEELYQILKLIL